MSDCSNTSSSDKVISDRGVPDPRAETCTDLIDNRPANDGGSSARIPATPPPGAALAPAIELAVGVYVATKAFQDCPFHECVCDARTGAIIAVTGPQGDPESQRYARLFAAAPTMLAALKAVEWGGVAGEEEGGYMCACPCCDAAEADGHNAGCQLHAAIVKSEGRAS